jgi:hypothetical protein
MTLLELALTADDLADAFDDTDTNVMLHMQIARSARVHVVSCTMKASEL